MPDSSHRTAKGIPPPSDQSPSAPAQENQADWDDAAFVLKEGTPAAEAAGAAFDLNAPPNPAGDAQPTVISRPPSTHNSGEHALHSLRGRRLAHFELIAPVGVGGMAAVIKGRDLQLDRTVALKVLPPDMAADPENVKRFHQEARAAAKLDHENIARVFYCGEDQKLHFIAFEFVQGDNLRTILERRGQLPVGEAVNYILQVTTGLAHAASRGVVHRDIKPSNIIITPQGRAKLVDMGLARSLAEHDSQALTHSGVTLGTFDYLSPEQAMKPRDADVRSDIYSLGCTFYHMLTGQPPVPEGTAAWKLHCHQHESPIDPRQMNPSVPDEVAAILSRMMAKNPRDRYQKPEQLVQELLHVAQKCDAGAETADGLLYVDAPIPSRPARPMIFAALAVIAVIALVFAVEQSGPQRPTVPAPRPQARTGPETKGSDTSVPVKPSDKAADSPRDPIRPAPAAQPFTWDESKTKAELLKFAEDNQNTQATLEIILNAHLDLSGDGADVEGKTLTLKGKKITIRSGDGQRREIALRYKGEKSDGASMKSALVLQAEQVELRGLRVVVTSAASVDVGTTGVEIVGGQKHEVTDCWFYQRYPNYTQEKPLTSLLLDGLRSRPELVLKDCVFLGEEGPQPPGEPRLEMSRAGRGGQYAVKRLGAGHIEAANCLFGPHVACFRLERGIADLNNDDVKLLYCSALLSDGSAVFHPDDDSSGRVSVSHSLFSRPQPRAVDGLPAVMVRQSGKNEDLFQYIGESNRYHGLDSFWTDGLRDVMPKREYDFAVLEATPWERSEPLSDMEKLQAAQAFQPRLTMRELRGKEGKKEVLIGAHHCGQVQKAGVTAFVSGKLPPVDSGKTATRKEKIVDPLIASSENGTFKTLSQAFEETRPGDVVLIKHNGKLSLNPLTWEKPGLDVIVKPAKDCKPVLTLATTKKDAALFELHEGRIEFQNLEFLLEPSQKDFEAQAVMAMAGDGSCVFKDCTITMGDPQGRQLAAVSLGDPAALMRRPVKPGEIITVGPSVVFERCLVRGKGDMIWCRSSRPFRLEVSNSAAALSGSFLSVEGRRSSESLPAPGPTDQGPRCAIDLQHVTAVVGGPLFSLRKIGDLKGLVPLKCKVTGCLFVPLASKPLVLLTDLDTKPSEIALKERFDWTGSKNVYGFLGMLEQELNTTEMMAPRPINRGDKWKELTSESDARFPELIKFAEPIDSSMLPRVRPSQLAVPELKDAGAGVESLPDPN